MPCGRTARSSSITKILRCVVLEEINGRVYRDLFGTPPEDPWLGLAPNDGYTALPGGVTRIQLPEAP